MTPGECQSHGGICSESDESDESGSRGARARHCAHSRGSGAYLSVVL
jgi:hypothetical protein